MADSDFTPKFAPFVGMAGIASALIFSSIGAAYGTAKAGIGIAGVGTFRPDLIMKARTQWIMGPAKRTVGRSTVRVAGEEPLSEASLIPVVMAGIIAVYGLVIGVLISQDIKPPPAYHYSLFSGFMHLGAGLSVGLAGLAAGYAIGIVGDIGVRSFMQQSRVFVGMVLILIFGEVLGLYGLIVGLILNSRS